MFLGCPGSLKDNILDRRDPFLEPVYDSGSLVCVLHNAFDSWTFHMLPP